MSGNKQTNGGIGAIAKGTSLTWDLRVKRMPPTWELSKCGHNELCSQDGVQ